MDTVSESGREEQSLALFSIGDLLLAVRSNEVETLLRGPFEISPFPQAPRHVLGVLRQGQTAVPVVDLAEVLRPASQPSVRKPQAYAVVLRHPKGRCAVPVDTIRGIVRCRPGELCAVEPASSQGRGVFGHVYVPAKGGAPFVLLEPQIITELEGVRFAGLREGCEAVSSTRSESQGGAGPVLIFEAAGACFGISADCVRAIQGGKHEVDPVPAHPHLLGYRVFQGANLPLIAFSSLVTTRPEADAGHVHLVLEFPEGGAILAVSRVVALSSYQALEQTSVMEAVQGLEDCLVGSFVREGAPIRLLDPSKVARWLQSVAGLSACERSSAQDVALSEDTASEGAVYYLIASVGARLLACPLLDLERVVELPATLMEKVSATVELGVISDGETVIQVFDLALLLGLSPVPLKKGDKVLVVKGEGGTLLGYRIRSVEGLRFARPKPLPGAGPSARSLFTHYVSVELESGRKSPCVLELRRQEGSLREPCRS